MANPFTPESKTKAQARESQREDLQDRRSGAYDNVAPKPAHPGREHATEHESAQKAAAIQPETEPPDESVPSGLRRPRQGPLSPTRGRHDVPVRGSAISKSSGIAPEVPRNEYFTPGARALCARVKHKSELTDDETLTLALAAAQAALGRYFHPGTRSAQEALEAIGAILDHEDLVAARQRKLRIDGEKEKAFLTRMDRPDSASE
jgi:hypothetical protein